MADFVMGSAVRLLLFSCRRLSAWTTAFVLAAVAAVMGLPVRAQTPSGDAPPPAAASGSESVLINGKPALRAGDSGADGRIVVEGSPNVFINGKPAAIVGGGSGCGGGAGSSNVFINGKPAARVGDGSGPCPATPGGK